MKSLPRPWYLQKVTLGAAAIATTRAAALLPLLRPLVLPLVLLLWRQGAAGDEDDAMEEVRRWWGC